ncbi:hypothetical protein B5F23_05395 [Olsenella sp. An188]|nr:hypothetical protein B5F23_05395 [Olsenella sp. An188]
MVSNNSNKHLLIDDHSYILNESRVVSQVSMKRNEKERFRRLAKNHGLSLSAFLRLAANDYIERNDWE